MNEESDEYKMCTNLFFLHQFKHFSHVSVCLSMNTSSMDIVSKLCVGHDEHTDVAHGA